MVKNNMKAGSILASLCLIGAICTFVIAGVAQIKGATPAILVFSQLFAALLFEQLQPTNKKNG